jgi:hypothetical protein
MGCRLGWVTPPRVGPAAALRSVEEIGRVEGDDGARGDLERARCAGSVASLLDERAVDAAELDDLGKAGCCPGSEGSPAGSPMGSPTSTIQ